MEYKIRNILESSIMEGSELITGEKGLSNSISDIIIMEAHDVKNWLKPDQLVLTSLFSLQDSSDEECLQFIREMVELKASGLIVRLGRFVDSIPSALIEGGEKYGLPIILIGEEVEYRDIVLEVMHNVLNRKAEMLDIFQNVHHEFKNLSLKEAPIRAILLALKRLIKKDVALENSKRVILESTLALVHRTKIIDSRKLYNERYMTYGYKRELIENDGVLTSQVVVTVELQSQDPVYLVIKEFLGFILMHDFMAIENAASSIQFEFAKELALSKVKQSHMNDLVDQILNKKYKDSDELMDLMHALKLSGNKKYRVITWMHRPELTGQKMSFAERERLFSNHYDLAKHLELVWPHFAYRIFENRLTFIIEDNFKYDYEFKRFIADSLKKIVSKSSKKLSTQVGISNKEEVQKISEIAHQPLKVIRIAKVQKKKEFVILYNDLGMYRLFFDLEDTSHINNYVREEITHMDQSDERTLRVFLDHNQNYTHTSELLFVHPKTVKYRIEKIKEVYEFDFEDPNEVFQLMLELRFKEFSKM